MAGIETARSVSAVIPTRGDVDTTEIMAALRACEQIDDITFVVGSTPANRYVSAKSAKHDWIWTQDDDCITDPRPVLEAAGEGYITNAMTPEHESNYPGRVTLVGFGAVFHLSLVSALDQWERDTLFDREADRFFTACHPHRTVYPSIRILPWATRENRMYRQPWFISSRVQGEQRIKEMLGHD